MNNDSLIEKTTGAEEVVWDLTDLYLSADDDVFISDLNTLEQKCLDFNGKWNGNIASKPVSEFVSMIEEYEGLVELMDKLSSFAQLVWSTNTEDPANGRMLQTTREVIAKAHQHVIFLSNEISELSDDVMNRLLNSREMESRRHWLELINDRKPYRLSNEVEQVLSLKSLSSRFAWVRLHDEMMSAQVFKLHEHEYTEAEIMKLLQEPSRETRRAAAEAITQGLKESARVQTYIFNTVVTDHYLNDQLRGFQSWISHRNLENEVPDESVNALINNVVERSDLLRRYYALKKRLLGFDEMFEYDRNAPVETDKSFWTWDAAKDVVVSAYSEFHPRFGEIVELFFDRSWIHAPVSKGKNGGAFSAGTIASVHPYIFLNYMGSDRDVQVLAHELGHGVHQYLSRSQGPLLMDTPLTIAETASVFGEMITFNKLFASAGSRKEKLSMLMGKIDDIVSTVYRQIMLNRFEDAMHTARRSTGELSVENMCDIWLKTQHEQYGDSITLTDGYRYWWSYISHFMHVPGYVYAYAYGELLVLALHEIYKSNKETFSDKYIKFLSSGGSKRPSELLQPFGINTDDPEFWKIGLGVIERMISEAEQLSEPYGQE
ncbi:MAG: M3 family oligoendopeptidase [Ignavibacteria bacterium]|nr:M3 family oligoendopeptidase [Ignavibacteria bacterium]